MTTANERGEIVDEKMLSSVAILVAALLKRFGVRFIWQIEEALSEYPRPVIHAAVRLLPRLFPGEFTLDVLNESAIPRRRQAFFGNVWEVRDGTVNMGDGSGPLTSKDFHSQVVEAGVATERGLCIRVSLCGRSRRAGAPSLNARDSSAA